MVETAVLAAVLKCAGAVTEEGKSGRSDVGESREERLE